MKAYVPAKTCMQLLPAASIVMAKIPEMTQYLLTGEQMNKLWHVHTMEYTQQ